MKVNSKDKYSFEQNPDFDNNKNLLNFNHSTFESNKSTQIQSTQENPVGFYNSRYKPISDGGVVYLYENDPSLYKKIRKFVKKAYSKPKKFTKIKKRQNRKIDYL